MYKVIMEEPATSDLRGLHNYVAETLKVPAAAQRIYMSIKAQVKTLDQNPQRCKVVDEEPFRTLGTRLLHVENYIAFFVIDEKNKKVHVLRILYNRREWQSILNCEQIPPVVD